MNLQGLGSSQLADHLVNEINQGPCYVKLLSCQVATLLNCQVIQILFYEHLGGRKEERNLRIALINSIVMRFISNFDISFYS